MFYPNLSIFSTIAIDMEPNKLDRFSYRTRRQRTTELVHPKLGGAYGFYSPLDSILSRDGRTVRDVNIDS